MKLFTAEAIKQLDAQCIQEQNITTLDLVMRAAKAFVNVLKQEITPNDELLIVAGKGNNGSDALAIGQLLLSEGYKAEVICLQQSCSNPTNNTLHKQLVQQHPRNIRTITHVSELPEIRHKVVIDGLLGIGTNRPIAGLYQECINAINQSNARVYAIDIPSGLPAEGCHFGDSSAIKAYRTLTFQFPKLSFFLPENYPFVGNFSTLDIDIRSNHMSTSYTYTEPYDAAQMLQKRNPHSHKGSFGHALFVGGSKGKIGAAILATRAALRSGAGLVSTCAPQCVTSAIHLSTPEAMTITQGFDTIDAIPDTHTFSAIGIGCGLGTAHDTQQALLLHLQQSTIPTVLDADALNIIAQKQCLHLIAPNSIITPHIKEFDRLAGASANNYERHNKALHLARKHHIYIVIKGHYTATISPEGEVAYNSTGNAGMATAGSGDVLTGIILALLAQQYPPFTAARLGVMLHGLAGDIAAQKHSQEALIASDIIEHLGEAFRTLHTLAERN